MPSEQSSKKPPPRKKSSKKPLQKNQKKPPLSWVSVGEIAGIGDITSSTKASWYCFLCSIDAVADMRPCIKCGRYVHEDCVGLSAHDEEVFICPSCEDWVITDVNSADRCNKAKQKQLYNFIIFCSNWGALHGLRRATTENDSPPLLKCMFWRYLLCPPPLPRNTLRYIFLSPLL